MFLGDPGFEYKEDINTGSKAAAAGGFTHICCLPNTNPVVHSKSEVEYIRAKSNGKVVSVSPLGAISRNCAGTEITEMYDMHKAGAVAFTDGVGHFVSAGFMQRSLQYVRPFEGLVISFPLDESIAVDGTMNEGPTSTVLGLKGIPALAEELIVKRDIQLAEYTGAKLHFAGISTGHSVELIAEAKSRNVPVTCSVAVHNLVFDDQVLLEYDSNFKVMPPLRSIEDREAVCAALSAGKIDSIYSGHFPQHVESKLMEFDLAEFGAIGLESAFGLANKVLRKHMRIGKLVDRLAIQPRKILGIEIPRIERNQPAELTLFDPLREWTFSEKDIKSKSKNSAAIGMQLVGKPLGIINNQQLCLN